MAQTDTSQLESQRNSNAHPDRMEGGAHETASTAIKAAALSFGADVVGIANVERWEAYARQVTGPPIYYRVPALLGAWVHAARPRVPGAWPTLD